MNSYKFKIENNSGIYNNINIQFLNEAWGNNKVQGYNGYMINNGWNSIKCKVKKKKRRNLTNIIKKKYIIANLHSEYYNDRLTPKI